MNLPSRLRKPSSLQTRKLAVNQAPQIRSKSRPSSSQPAINRFTRLWLKPLSIRRQQQQHPLARMNKPESRPLATQAMGRWPLSRTPRPVEWCRWQMTSLRSVEWCRWLVMTTLVMQIWSTISVAEQPERQSLSSVPQTIKPMTCLLSQDPKGTTSSRLSRKLVNSMPCLWWTRSVPRSHLARMLRTLSVMPLMAVAAILTGKCRWITSQRPVDSCRWQMTMESPVLEPAISEFLFVVVCS